jgi:hypothetical protein
LRQAASLLPQSHLHFGFGAAATSKTLTFSGCLPSHLPVQLLQCSATPRRPLQSHPDEACAGSGRRTPLYQLLEPAAILFLCGIILAAWNITEVVPLPEDGKSRSPPARIDLMGFFNSKPQPQQPWGSDMALPLLHVDLTKRYDIYLREIEHDRLYENVQFMSLRSFDRITDFLRVDWDVTWKLRHWMEHDV